MVPVPDAPIPLGDVPAIQTELERVYLDTLALNNSPARSRTLVAVLTAAINALAIGEHEERLAALEARAAFNYPRRAA